MAVRFNLRRNRLLVGYRGTDFSEVWAQLKDPKEDDDDANVDGVHDFELFTLPTGERGIREPKPSEVKWLPHFDPDNCIAKDAKDRKRLQRETISDAILYLRARDVDEVRNLEAVMDLPHNPRWYSWFHLAKAYKRKQLRNLADGVEGEDDKEDDDSAYGGDDDDRMPPPSRRPNQNKRRAPARGNHNGAKRSRVGRQTQLRFDQRYQMTGGLGPASVSTRSSNEIGRGSVATDNMNEYDDDAESADFDPAPPQYQDDNVINGNDLDDILSAHGSRRRGNSRSVSPYNRFDIEPSYQRGQSQVNIGLDADYQRRFQEYNGPTSEEEAMRRQRQASVSMPPAPQQDADDEDLQRAIQASQRDHQAGDEQNEA